MIDAATLKQAARAQKLSRDGMKCKAIGQKLGVTTGEANRLLVVALCQDRLKTISKMCLTDSERTALRAVAALERDHANDGIVRGVESRDVACVAGKSPGWPTATINRRLGGRHENPRMGLVIIAGNGYLRLTELGWIVVHAMEAAG